MIFFFFFPETEVNLRQKTQRELLAHTKKPSDWNPAGSSASSLTGRSLESIQHMKAGKCVCVCVDTDETLVQSESGLSISFCQAGNVSLSWNC